MHPEGRRHPRRSVRVLLSAPTDDWWPTGSKQDCARRYPSPRRMIVPTSWAFQHRKPRTPAPQSRDEDPRAARHRVGPGKSSAWNAPRSSANTTLSASPAPTSNSMSPAAPRRSNASVRLGEHAADPGEPDRGSSDDRRRCRGPVVPPRTRPSPCAWTPIGRWR